MKKLLAFAALAGFALTLSGCLSVPVKPPVGMIYNDTQAPLDYDYNKTAVAPKKGVSSMQSILGLVSMGDASTRAAAQNGNIQTVEYADYHFYNVLGVIQRYETIVYGN